MKSTAKIQSMLLSAALATAIITSCGGDEPDAPTNKPETPASPDIETLIADNITVTSTFDNPMWTFTITSTLDDKLPGQKIDYYLRLTSYDRKLMFGLESLEKNEKQGYTESFENNIRTTTLYTPFYTILTDTDNPDYVEYAFCTSFHGSKEKMDEKRHTADWTDEHEELYQKVLTYFSETAANLHPLKAQILIYTKFHSYPVAEFTLSDFLPE